MFRYVYLFDRYFGIREFVVYKSASNFLEVAFITDDVIDTSSGVGYIGGHGGFAAEYRKFKIDGNRNYLKFWNILFLCLLCRWCDFDNFKFVNIIYI